MDACVCICLYTYTILEYLLKTLHKQILYLCIHPMCVYKYMHFNYKAFCSPYPSYIFFRKKHNYVYQNIKQFRNMLSNYKILHSCYQLEKNETIWDPGP